MVKSYDFSNQNNNKLLNRVNSSASSKPSTTVAPAASAAVVATPSPQPQPQPQSIKHFEISKFRMPTGVVTSNFTPKTSFYSPPPPPTISASTTTSTMAINNTRKTSGEVNTESAKRARTSSIDNTDNKNTIQNNNETMKTVINITHNDSKRVDGGPQPPVQTQSNRQVSANSNAKVIVNNNNNKQPSSTQPVAVVQQVAEESAQGFVI